MSMTSLISRVPVIPILTCPSQPIEIPRKADSEKIMFDSRDRIVSQEEKKRSGERDESRAKHLI